MLPRLENCQCNPNGLVDLFSFANSQLKGLYVTYCKGQKKSESILREQIEYFEVPTVNNTELTYYLQ